MLILIGKTASGKDAISSELIREYGFSKVVRYTTRPIRKEEIPGDTYYFISQKEFFEKVESNFFAEWKEYDTVHGKWYYGTSEESLLGDTQNKVIILPPACYRDVKDKLVSDTKVAYIYANNMTIEERLLKRGDNSKEAQRRLQSDNADFKGIEYEVEKIFYNNRHCNISDVVEDIVNWYSNAIKKS